MANQPQPLTLPPPRTFTRTDFTALRAFVQRIEPAVIARLYYDADTAPHAATPAAMADYLRAMRDELVKLAILNGSPVLADHLKASIKKHGSAKLTAVTLRMVGQAAQLAAAAPAATHGVGLWFRPLVARRLTAEGIATLGELVGYCNRHGGSWWRSVPRIGPLRARTIVAWLRRHEATLECHVDADVDVRPLTPAADTAIVIGGSPDAPRLAPFERLAVPAALSGGEGAHRGANRAGAFAFIRAPHDLAALHAWLHRYRDRPATLRAYTREVERLVLWAVTVRGTAVSSMTVEDCEAYKDFLARPAPAFTGPKRPRTSGRWRPFTGALSAGSQAYAVRVLRAAFAWLVEVRYLAGNPWSAVTDPSTVTREVAVQVERALPADLWCTLRAALDARCGRPGDDASQWRAARAAILLMGDSGLRRAEAAWACRDALRRADVPVGRPAETALARREGGPAGRPPPSVWMLAVTGKRRKQRTVPVSAAAIDALRAHWADRGLAFDDPVAAAHAGVPLIAPLVVPGTPAAQARHADGEAPYAIDALGRLVREAIRRLMRDLQAAGRLSPAALAQLEATSAHALRHTFGSGAVARDMPLDVVQLILGHASLQTTSIYVRAGQQRMLEAAAHYYAGVSEAPMQAAGGGLSGEPVPAHGEGLVLQTATLILTLRIENASRSGRGRKRTIEYVERWVLEDYDAQRLADGEYELKVPYGTDDELDRLVMTLLDDIEMEAQARQCANGSQARRVGHDRIWTLDAGAHCPDGLTPPVVPDRDDREDNMREPLTPVWRLRIGLADIEPEVWRQIEVPAGLTLAHLHQVIQAAMGWDDAHLYSFSVGDAVIDIDHGVHRVRLDTVCRPGDVIGYLYDFGDEWRHEIVVEADLAPQARVRYPRCVAGRNACPPEDCGGPWGYADLVETLAGGRSPEKRELLEWLGGPFDAGRFSVAQANTRLARIRKDPF